MTSSSAAPCSRRSAERGGECRAPRLHRAPCTARRSRSSRGACTMARAMDTRCCSPRLSARTGVSARSATRIWPSARRAAPRGIAHAVQPRGELHVLARRERAVEHARVRDRARPARAPPAGPSRRARRPRGSVPAVGASSPARSRRSVVLPAPLGPKSARQSPAPSGKITPSTARRAPNARDSPRRLDDGRCRRWRTTGWRWASAEDSTTGRHP